jgi:hypothetical protein
MTSTRRTAYFCMLAVVSLSVAFGCGAKEETPKPANGTYYTGELEKKPAGSVKGSMGSGFKIGGK